MAAQQIINSIGDRELKKIGEKILSRERSKGVFIRESSGKKLLLSWGK